MNALQEHRPVEVLSPLGGDQLIFRRMRGREALGRLFEYNLELYSEDPGIKLTDVLGQNMTIRLARADGQQRYFHGVVAEFHRGGSAGRYTRYLATLRPWLWLLSHTADCRMMPADKTAPEIIKQVLRDSGLGDIEDAMFGSYRSREYCVQYRETAFNFVSRLMEEEGIYYYFQHERDKHTVVLCDSVSAHEVASGYETIPYARAKGASPQEQEQFSAWSRSRRVLPTEFSLTDYDFEKPGADLLVRSTAAQEYTGAGFEVFDFPGHFRSTQHGEGYVRARMEEQQAQHEQVVGSGNPRGVGVGQLFSLVEHPVAEENTEYLVVDASYDIDGGELESGAASDVPIFFCTLALLPSQVPFRSARRTPIPIVQGPQTAVVVGKSGEEIWTDQYGRVKVQFAWDRYGKRDEQSSCWVRVSHPSAGQGWGAFQIPRIGQEVIVSFLEGNPDAPIITGRVYNAEQMPPVDLPGAGMVSGMKSASTPGGGGYNEMTMDDTKGKEKVVIHGQYDMATTVENDETLTVNNNRTKTVAVDETNTIGANSTTTIGANSTTSVGANMSLSVGASKTETVAVASALTIGAAYQVSVGAAMNETVGALKAEEVGGAKTVAVGAASSETVGGNKSTTAGGNISSTAGKKISATAGSDVTVSAGGKMGLSSKGNMAINSKAKGVIQVADELTIKCGGATITLKSSGDIQIKGAKINIKGSGDVVIKGSKIGQN